MCNIFKCNRAGKYIGYYNNLSEAVYHNPNPQKDWFFTNGETLSIFMYNGFSWVNTNRVPLSSAGFEIIDDPVTFIPSIASGEVKTYFYIAGSAGNYTFTNFGNTTVSVSSASLIELNWDGTEWIPSYYEFDVAPQSSIPGIDIRIKQGEISSSEIFGIVEEGNIKNSHIEFKINSNFDYVIKEAPNLFICLVRRVQDWKKRNIYTRKRERYTKFSIAQDRVEEDFLSVTYPQQNGFDPTSKKIFWTKTAISPISLSALFDFYNGDTYNGQWIKYPFSLEEIIRRYIYITNYNSEYNIVVSPKEYFSNYQKVYTPRHARKNKFIRESNYFTTIFGLCIGRRNGKYTSNIHYDKGPITLLRGKMKYFHDITEQYINYSASIHGSNSFISK